MIGCVPRIPQSGLGRRTTALERVLRVERDCHSGQGSQCVWSILKPFLERYNYRNSIQGLYRMTKEEGFSSWGRGIVPNGARAVLMNMSQLAR